MASAGRKASRCGSDRVMSTAVANDVRLVTRRSSPSSLAKRSGTANPR